MTSATRLEVRSFENKEEIDASTLRGSPRLLVVRIDCTGWPGESRPSDRAERASGFPDHRRSDSGGTEELSSDQGAACARPGGRGNDRRRPDRVSSPAGYGVAGESSDDEQRIRLVAAAVHYPADFRARAWYEVV